MLPDKVVNDGECHVRVDGGRAISQQQRGVHDLANLAGLNDKCGLHALADGYKVVVYGAYGEQSKFTTSHPEIQEKVAKMNLRKPALPPNMSAGGHGGSHGYLTNDFIEAILLDRLPLVNVAVALNTTMCGVVAHQSALKDGELLKIPQFML